MVLSWCWLLYLESNSKMKLNCTTAKLNIIYIINIKTIKMTPSNVLFSKIPFRNVLLINEFLLS